MNRRITRTAALALLGTALLAPGTAHADPVFSVVSQGTPVPSQATGELGQEFSITSTGCVNPIEGEPAYVGEFVSIAGDPLTHPAWQPFEFVADENGGFSETISIPLDNGLGDFHVRFYCASEPITSLEDPNVMWLGPTYTMTISQGAQPNGASMNRVLSNTTVAKTSGAAGTTVSFTQDPDALPAVDKMQIPGDIAAQLKAEVDARAENIGHVQRMYEVFLARRADPQGLVYWEQQAEGRNLKSIANRMANSPEYKRNFGDLTDEQFLEQVYQTALDRDPDPSGWNHWLESLGSKRIQRVELAMNFANSPEFIRRTAAANYVITAFQVATPGVANPSIEEIDAYAARLAAGELKVTVIEDIALTVADADWWIAQG